MPPKKSNQKLQEKQKEILQYKKNDIVIVHESPDNLTEYSLLKLNENVPKNKKTIKAIQLDEGKKTKLIINYAEGKTKTIKNEEILQKIDNFDFNEKNKFYQIKKEEYLEKVKLIEKNQEHLDSNDDNQENQEVPDDEDQEQDFDQKDDKKNSKNQKGQKSSKASTKQKQISKNLEVQVENEEEKLVNKKQKLSLKKAKKMTKRQLQKSYGDKNFSDSEISNLSDSEEYVTNSQSPHKSKNKRSPKKPKSPKYKRGIVNPKITDVIEKCNQLESLEQKIQNDCCVKCSNKEFIRAINTNNQKLLDQLLSSENTISNLFERWGPDSKVNSFLLIFKNRDQTSLNKLFKIYKKSNQFQWANNPICGLREIDTGFNNKYAYGVRTRKVAMMRGGREGNNAFVHDLQETTKISEADIYQLCFNEIDLKMLDHVRVIEPSLESSIIKNFQTAVRAGNHKLAGYIANIAINFGGYGFNKLIYQVLTESDPQELLKDGPLKKQSILKVNVFNQITPLHCACINPNPGILELILENCSEYTKIDEQLKKPIHYAAVCESSGPLKVLLSHQIDVREVDQKKNTALILAAINGRVQNIKLLLEKNKSNIDAKNRDGNTALHMASYYNHLDCVKILIENGANVKLNGQKKMGVLHQAASQGNFEIIRYLIEEAKMKPLGKDKFKRSPLIMAVRNGHIKIASYLLQKGAAFDEPDSSKNSPIHYAAAYGFKECIPLLIQAGCNQNTKNQWNLTALSVAMQKGHFGCVKELLSFPNTDVNCKDDRGRTLVSNAIDSLNQQNFQQIVYLIEEKKADLNLGDLKGWTPMHYVANITQQSVISQHKNWNELSRKEKEKIFQNHQAVTQKLISLFFKNKADINKESLENHTPFDIALQNKNYAICKLFLNEESIDLDKIYNNNSCVYHKISENLFDKKCREIFDILTQKIKNSEVLINLVDDEGFTPILKFFQDFGLKALQKFEHYKIKITEEKKNEKKSKLSQKKKKNNNLFQDEEIQLSEKQQNEVIKKSFEKFSKAEDGFIFCIRKLIEMGANLNMNVQKLKKLRNSIQMNEEKGSLVASKVKKISIEEEIDKKKKDSPYNIFGLRNAYHFVMNFPSLKILKFLFQFGELDFDQQDYYGLTPMHLFVQNNHTGHLLQDNQDENYPKTPEILQFILREKSPNLQLLDDYGENCLFQASQQGKSEFFEDLIQKQSKINIITKKGEIPLLKWVKKRNLEMVEMLLNLGADPNFKDKKNRTALHWAVNNSNSDSDASFELENLLIQFKADINSKDKRGRVPLHYAFVKISKSNESSSIDPIETVSSLLGYKNCEINVKDNWGKTPLHYAAQRGSNISGIYLINQGADIESKDNVGNTPMCVAFIHKHQHFAMILAQNKADIKIRVNVRDKEEMKKTKGQLNQQTNDEEQAKKNENEDEFYSFENQLSNNEKLKQKESFEMQEDANLDEELEEKENYQRGFGEQDDEEEEDYEDENFQQKNYFFNPYNESNHTSSKLTPGTYSLFQLAVRYEWQGMAYLLIQNKYPLMLAVQDSLKENKFQLVLTLLFKTNDHKILSQVNEKQQNLMHILAMHGSKCNQPELIKKILRQMKLRQISPYSQDCMNKTPLHYACESMFFFLINELLQDNCDPSLKDSEGNSCLSLYMKKNKFDIKMMEIFLEKGAHLDQRFPQKLFQKKREITPLLYYISQGEKDIQILNWFLANGSNINESDDLGQTPLIYAIRENKKKLVNFCLNSEGFQPDKQIDCQNRNPIHHVVNPLVFGSYENTKIFEILASKFDINQKDKYGKPPLYYAYQQDSGNMVQALKKQGAVDQWHGKIQRGSTSIISEVKWPEDEINFEQDAEAYIFQKEKENEKLNKLNKKEKTKPNKYAQKIGYHLELVYENEEPIECLLTKIDIKHGLYSQDVFYQIQLLYELNRALYIIFTRWGRNGDEGQHQLTPFSTLDEAKREFEKIFKEKSGNEWSNHKNFEKKPKKYHLMQFEPKINRKEFLTPIDFQKIESYPSILDQPTQDLIKTLSKIQTYSSAISQFGIDAEYLNLTYLKKEHILESKEILIEIQNLVEEIDEMKKDNDIKLEKVLQIQEDIAEKSSRFYELIPFSQYKTEAIPSINDLNVLNNKFRIIENLIDFEVTTKILLGAQWNLNKINPIDYIYKALNIRMTPLEPSNPEYELIQLYISNSQDASKNFLKNIFAVECKVQTQRYQQWKNFPNRMMLWHGTSNTNLMSILYQGLRIFPSTSIYHGSTFGPGIYFADYLNKSLNYCQNQWNSGFGQKNNSKFLMLCEVALGKIHELDGEDFNGLPSNCNSIKAIGKQAPNPKQNIYLINGAILPAGKIIKVPEKKHSNKNYSRYLNYNEYIVYDESQIKLRYLIELNDQQ